MLELQKLLWVLPGVIFIHIYNKRRPIGSINLSGWSYIFSLVVVATIVWLPTEGLINKIDISEYLQNIISSIIAILVSALLAILFASEKISKFVFLPVYDIFFINCIKWENKPVILSLKNDKAYIGILLKYPENPKSKYETQMISILPLISGGREQHTKQVAWKVHYPQIQEDSFEVMIPRSEIVTFGKFNKNIFKHFTKKEFSNEESRHEV